MSRWIPRRVLPLLASALLLSACQPAAVGFQPIVFPNSALLGSTIAMAIDSTYIPAFDSLEDQGLSTANVMLRLKNASGSESIDIAPSAVFDGTNPLSSFVAADPTVAAQAWGKPGTVLTIAVANLPTSLAPGFGSYPQQATLTLLRKVGSTWEERANIRAPIEVLGPRLVNGQPTPNPITFSLPSLETLKSRSRLRLRAQTGTGGMPTTTPPTVIGSIEFELAYPSTVSGLEAIPSAEAIESTAIVSTISPGVARVMLVDPKGFVLERPQGLAPTNRLGEGPFVDIVFNARTGPFETTDFAIRNLVVSRWSDGLPIVNQRGAPNGGDSSTFVSLIATGNE